MEHNQLGRSQNNGLVWPRNTSLMLTTLGYNVREMIQWSYICVVEMSFALLVVPMDLDVKMKAVMLGACFLIVSIKTLTGSFYEACLSAITLSYKA